MKKANLLLLALFTITTIFAQKDKTKVTAKKVEPAANSFDSVTIIGQLTNCSAADSFSLWRVEGMFRNPYTFSKPDADGKFTFKLARTATPQFIFLGMNYDDTKLKPIIVGTEKEVFLSGGCYNPLEIQATSPLNTAYIDVFRRANQLKLEMNKVVQNYQLNYNDANFRKQFEGEMLVVDKQKLAFLDSLKKNNPFLGKLIALDTYTSFQHDPKKANYADEIQYFATQFFQYVNWKDAEYDNIPLVYELFRSYAQVILMPQLGLKKAQIKDFCNQMLEQIPAQSNARKLATLGLASKMFELQHPLSVDYSENYVKDFPFESETRRQQMYTMMNQVKAQMLDVPAPEIAQEDTTGVVRKLSDMKGKVVLVDFWASWCGPCRRENPNVVRLYNKYKNNGFDIYSVSLDQDKARWIKAINDDNLMWASHVSDLKYWQNEAAKTYGVSSIPSTVLVDKEGLIIGRNLRGQSLEEKLKQIFGF